jgi:site-specific recombinase XerD
LKGGFIKMGDYKITKDKFFDREERIKLMKTCKDKAELDLLKGRTTWPKRYMLVDIALFTGLRVSEIASLKMEDLSLKTKDPFLIVRNGKRGKKRDVYLSNRLTRQLKKYIDYKKKTLNESIDDEAYLFPGRNGEKTSVFTLMMSFKRAIREAGLPEHYSIHSARHTYATYLLHNTQDLRYVQKQLGHSNINTTALYADVLPEQNGKLANLIEQDVEI